MNNSNIRETETYKNLTSYNAVGLAEGFVEGDEDEQIAAWQWLHDTRMAYSLQGWFGRTATKLIENGIILK